MANNPYVNKVVCGTTTLIDISDTTATADKILQGYGCYGADGAWMDGTAVAGGGGGSSYTLIATDEFTVNTSSTSAKTVGTLTYEAGSSYDMRDKVICVTVFDKQGLRNGHFYGSIFYFTCSQAYNTGSVGGGICYRYGNNSVGQTANKYGVYCSNVTSANTTNNITITISSKYSSTYSLTIDGTFEVNAYLLDWPDGTSPIK